MFRRPLSHEPHKIKTVRAIHFPSYEERKRNLARVHFNVLRLPSQQVSFDLCSQGSSALSQEQLSGQLLGDEAYAGARNFGHLQAAVSGVLGHTYVCPTHNLLGSLKLLLATLVPEGSIIPSNARTLGDSLKPRRIDSPDIRDHEESVFTGNCDLRALHNSIQEDSIAFVYAQAFADGQHPFSLTNLLQARSLVDGSGIRLVLEGSRIIENAWYIQQHETPYGSQPIAQIVRQIVKASHVLVLDGAQDPKCGSGGILTTDNPNDYERFINAVVVYEGLHTYGGMSGRTLETLARGLGEMTDEAEVQWVMQQTERFTAHLREAGIPLERGCDGAYIRADQFLPQVENFVTDTFSATLYLLAGVRAVDPGLEGRDDLVPVQIPRLALMNQQLDQIIDSLVSLYRQRDRVRPLEVEKEGPWRDQMRFRAVYPDLDPFEFNTYPYTIHTFERVGTLTRGRRRQAMEAAGFNTFLLRSADVTIDLLTDSGTSAMSCRQWDAYNAARPTVSMSGAYRKLVDQLREILGYRHIIPTHQGRAAEQILSEVLIEPGQLVPGNMYFTTTKLHQELAGGVFADVIVDEAHVPESEYPWKGNIDLQKLMDLVHEQGAQRIAYVSFEHSVNMAGGQPVSMQNMKEIHAYCNAHGIPVLFDATRCVENACMIQLRDPVYQRTPVRDILREMMLYGDGCTISAKKDFLVNIGGILAFRENDGWAFRAQQKLRTYEGNVTDGGLSVADLAALAQGAEEMLDDGYIRSRVRQTQKLGQMLRDAEIPIVLPPGSHAIFLDARRFLDHLDQDRFPAQSLAAQLFIETGVRAMERGNVSKGRNPETGENYRPALELVRLTIPRRVYTEDHLEAVAKGVIRLYQRRHQIRGLRFVYEPKLLRFFQGRFEPV